MALEVKNMPRTFVAKVRDTDMNLPDPSPTMTSDEVKNHYSSVYPELINAKITGPNMKANCVEYVFESKVGVKG